MRPILHLIPGTMCNERLWSKLRPCLEDTYDLVHLPIPRNKNIAQLADYFAATLTTPVNLLGFSLGGYIAAYFAHKYPQQVSRLFVISNNLSALPDAEVMERLQLLDWIAAHGYSGMSYKKAASLLNDTKQHMAAQYNNQKELVELIRKMDTEMGQEELISQNTNTTKRCDIAVNAAAFLCPTYLYFSENDPLMRCQWLDHSIDANTGLSITILPGTGHMLPLEQPEHLAKTIRHWMSAQL